MLADLPSSEHAGRIETEVLLPATALYELIDFIVEELPRWRDHPERRSESSEPKLTSQLCAHLNGAAYYSRWDHIQFLPEVPDEVCGGRKIDLAAKPCGATLIIEGRRHCQFDTLLPIECKRLPTPREKGRDEREYVITEPGTTGGIQRFKFGYHGADHHVGAMIAYVQDRTLSYWLAQVNCWILDLSAEINSLWSESDRLQPLQEDSPIELCTLQSHHRRKGGLDVFELRHLWIKMN